MKDFLLVIAYLLIGFAIGFWVASRDVVSIKFEGKDKCTNEVTGQTTATQDSVFIGSEMVRQIMETQELEVAEDEMLVSKQEEKVATQEKQQKKEEPKPVQNVVVPKENTAPKSEPKKTEPEVKEEFNPKALTVASFVQDWVDREAHLSIKNNLDKKITSFKATIIYKSMNGDDLDYEEINQNIEIAPQMAKSIKIKGYGHDMDYAYYKSQIKTTQPDRKFQIEFKLNSYK